MPTALADNLRIYSIMLPSMFTSAAILFGILDLHDGPGAVVVAALFGCSTGACKSRHSLFEVHAVWGARSLFIDCHTPIIIDVSLVPSLLAMMCKELTDLGYAVSLYMYPMSKSSTCLLFLIVLFPSLRMGLAFSSVAVANLLGNPIAGILLGKSARDDGSLTWWRVLVFAAVSLFYPLIVDRNY